LSTNAESLHCPLTVDERLALFDVIDALERVSSAEQFIACMDSEMQRIFPHGGIGCGIGNIAKKHVKPYRMLLHNFPRAYIESLRQSDGGLNSPLMTRWRAILAPVIVDLEHSFIGWSLSWLMNLKKYDMRNIAVHGLVDVQGVVTSYFCFIRMPRPLGDKHIYLMNYLVPYLHVALVRAMATLEDMTAKEGRATPSSYVLSDRQKEVLRWIHLGKTNVEIAQILATSEDNIKYHVSQILAKLHVRNRMQAVVKALNLNIIEM